MEKTKYIIYTAFAILALLLGIAFATWLESRVFPNSLPEIDPTIESSEAEPVQSDGTEGPVGWHQVMPDSDSNYGHTGYKELENWNGTKYSQLLAENDVNGDLSEVYGAKAGNYTLYTGHVIYVSEMDLASEETQAGTTNDGGATPYSIICGNGLLPLDVTKKLPSGSGYLLREPETGERIRLFDTQEELDAANASWETGQDVLSGKTEEEQGMIVLDGRLIPQHWSMGSNGEAYIPLYDVAKEYSEGTNLTKNGVLTVPLDEPFGIYISIPSKKVLGWTAADSFGISEEGDTWTYKALAIPGDWTKQYPLTDTSFNVTLNEVVELLGWKVETDGVLVKITTDSCNDNNRYMLRQ